MIYHGAFTEFPFEDHSGIFTVDVELSNSQFNFDDNWADITGFAANLNFTNNSMMITARAGELSGLDITGVKVGIAELAIDPVLTVDLELKNVDPADITQLMINSTLADTVGTTLQQLVISNNINGQFNLALPLDRPDEVVATGLIDFSDNLLALQTPALNFSQVNGQLTFINDVIKTEGLQLIWQGLPLELIINSSDQERSFNTNIQLNANWLQKDWLQHMPEPLKKYVQGQLLWQGDLDLNSHHDGGFSYHVDVQSTFEGLDLSIPAPYQKTPQQVTDFSIQLSGGVNSSTIEVKLGEQLSFYGLLNHQSKQAMQITPINNATAMSEVFFSRAHLVLGNEKMLLPMDGFHITSALAEADFASWQPFVMDILASVTEPEQNPLNIMDLATTAENITALNNKAKTRSLLAQPDRIRGSIGKLNILGQSLTDVSFNVLDQEQWWLLQVNAKEVRTEVKFFPSWLAEGIDVNADFLHLTSDIEEHSPAKILLSPLEQFNIDKNIFNSIPPIRLICDSCRVGKVDFGKLAFELQRTEANKINISHFSASRNKSNLSLKGWWQFDDNPAEQILSQTSLTGKLTVNDIEFEMEKLGFASSIKDSGAVLDFSLNWQGGPQDFVLGELNGELKAKLDDGVLADVDHKGLKVASILSLGSLARKLKLDFRDIFSEGMFYSNITGDFQIKHGVIYTENT